MPLSCIQARSIVGLKISSEVADGPQSVILQQVEYGIAVRMAILSLAMSSSDHNSRSEGGRGR